ncbi:hypothetical protein K469DRAFT_707944, partial [Zopfia rhizophila CBS 207.26]
ISVLLLISVLSLMSILSLVLSVCCFSRNCFCEALSGLRGNSYDSLSYVHSI